MALGLQDGSVHVLKINGTDHLNYTHFNSFNNLNVEEENVDSSLKLKWCKKYPNYLAVFHKAQKDLVIWFVDEKTKKVNPFSFLQHENNISSFDWLNIKNPVITTVDNTNKLFLET